LGDIGSIVEGVGGAVKRPGGNRGGVPLVEAISGSIRVPISRILVGVIELGIRFGLGLSLPLEDPVGHGASHIGAGYIGVGHIGVGHIGADGHLVGQGGIVLDGGGSITDNLGGGFDLNLLDLGGHVLGGHKIDLRGNGLDHGGVVEPGGLVAIEGSVHMGGSVHGLGHLDAVGVLGGNGAVTVLDIALAEMLSLRLGHYGGDEE